jgi:outer membrane protein assembly factor BamB
MKRWNAWMVAALCLAPGVGLAVGTKSFVIDTSDAFEKGTLKGTAAHASGMLTAAPALTRTPLDGVPVAYTSTVGKDGAIYVGTGSQGAIYRVTKEGAKLFADTDAALVTSLVWADGTLYAATLPGARVFAIDGGGKAREFAKLQGADHIWALAFASKTRVLYAATGPEGKLFAIDLSGKAQQLHDDEAEHLLSLALDEEQRVYVGTSNGARLLRVSGRTVEVLHDFPGQELDAVDVGGGFIAVAANEFPPPPPAAGDTRDLGAAARGKRMKPGKGSVFTLGFDGNVTELARFEEAHVSALAIDEKGQAVQAGLAQEGRVVRLARSGERATWVDVDERQIVSIQLDASVPHLVSSDGVAVYRMEPSKAEALWTSAVLDAKTRARFGELVPRVHGALQWATRSGNTEKPDATWSAWSAESSTAGPIKSAAARFLQLRAKLAEGTELYALEAYYLPQNQPARVRNVRRKGGREETKDKPPSTAVPLTWDIDNPDEDKLRYRLFARREGEQLWRPLQREHELLEQTDYSWETRSTPDGYYRVRVVVGDEASNPEPYVARSEAVSAPILVDNRAPELLELRFEKGALVGRAVDALGPIASLELIVDNELARPIAPQDDLLDTRDERFRVPLTLIPGVHALSVRVKDAAENVATGAIEITVATP